MLSLLCVIHTTKGFGLYCSPDLVERADLLDGTDCLSATQFLSQFSNSTAPCELNVWGSYRIPSRDPIGYSWCWWGQDSIEYLFTRDERSYRILSIWCFADSTIEILPDTLCVGGGGGVQDSIEYLTTRATRSYRMLVVVVVLCELWICIWGWHQNACGVVSFLYLVLFVLFFQDFTIICYIIYGCLYNSISMLSMWLWFTALSMGFDMPIHYVLCRCV